MQGHFSFNKMGAREKKLLFGHLVLDELRELEGEGKINELEGVHGSRLIQIVGIEDGLGLLLGGTVDVQVGQQSGGLLEGQMALTFSISRAEQVEGEADEQEGGDEGVVVEAARVGGIGHGLEGLDGTGVQVAVAHGVQEGSDFRGSSASIVGLSVEKGDGVHDQVVEPHEDSKGDLSISSNIDQTLSVSEDLGGEASETKLAQDVSELLSLRFFDELEGGVNLAIWNWISINGIPRTVVR